MQVVITNKIFAKYLKHGQKFVILDDDQNEYIGPSGRIIYTRDKSVLNDAHGLGCSYPGGTATVSPLAKVGVVSVLNAT